MAGPIGEALLATATATAIERDGRIFLDQTEIALEALDPTLKQFKAASPELTLQLHADNGVDYGRAAKVMAVIQRAGIDKLVVMMAVEQGCHPGYRSRRRAARATIPTARSPAQTELGTRSPTE